MKITHKLTAQILIGSVILVNLQCAMLFILFPDQFAGSFELAGVPGRSMVQGMGILFVMWNIPYLVAFYDPLRHRISHMEAIAMQLVGLAGESILLLNLPAGYLLLRSTAIRFIVFDAVGLVILGLAYAVVARNRPLLR